METSSIDGAPGAAQLLLARKVIDGAKEQAAGLLAVLPPVTPVADLPLPPGSTRPPVYL
ncbi:hypothetical protein [Vallicoccus soli]|uniref:hypothetical protein n=1 Tax=Vallicoccus soli TaxID=2339232 RepID=UPI001401CB90|nr:hypothetical protein [Vallicoccus soli]